MKTKIIKITHKPLIYIMFLSIFGCSANQTKEMGNAPAAAASESFFETSLSKMATWYMQAFADFENPETLVVEQELKGVSVEMLDWWWNNINDSARYQSWHPEDHIYFKWITEPTDKNATRYIPGTVQEVRERIGGIPATLEITWMPYDHPGYDITEEHFVKATGRMKGNEDKTPLLFSHEYYPTKDGILMRSVFKVPSGLPSMFTDGLKIHCQEEMQYLSKVLPGYYKEK